MDNFRKVMQERVVKLKKQYSDTGKAKFLYRHEEAKFLFNLWKKDHETKHDDKEISKIDDGGVADPQPLQNP
jgi:hypothetical protein